MSANTITALAASGPGAKLLPVQLDLGELGPEQVEVEVLYCGLCHSDYSMLHNEWGMSSFPLVAGHEVVGRVVAAGPEVRGLTEMPGVDPIGKLVGVGWYAGSCMACRHCLSGDHNLCLTAEQTIVGRPGGFATRVRCHWAWAAPIPEGLDEQVAGPLFCGGITVFNPIVQNNIAPTARVGVIGIGGLGHMALQFLNKWGCEVHAFSSTAAKADEARGFGAHYVTDSKSASEMKKLNGSLDFVLATVSADMDWGAYLNVLAPKGRLHFVGIPPAPLTVHAFSLIGQEKSISGTPLGSPATLMTMLKFCTRHHIAPTIEKFPMTQVNDAIAHLEAGKARYRIVLENDLKAA